MDRPLTKAGLRIQEALDSPVAFGRPSTDEEKKVFSDQTNKTHTLYSYGLASKQRFVVDIPYSKKPVFVLRPMQESNQLPSLREVHWEPDSQLGKEGKGKFTFFFKKGRTIKSLYEELLQNSSIWERMFTVYQEHVKRMDAKRAILAELKAKEAEKLVRVPVVEQRPESLSKTINQTTGVRPVFRKKLPNRRLHPQEIDIYTLLESPIQQICEPSAKERKLFPDEKSGIFRRFDLKSGQSFIGCIDEEEVLFKPLNNSKKLPYLEQIRYEPMMVDEKKELDCFVSLNEDRPKECFLYLRILGPFDGKKVIPHPLSEKALEIQTALIDLKRAQEKFNKVLGVQEDKKDHNIIQQKLNERRQNG